MAIGRNPNEPPQADPAKDEVARMAGLKRIQIIWVQSLSCASYAAIETLRA